MNDHAPSRAEPLASTSLAAYEGVLERHAVALERIATALEGLLADEESAAQRARQAENNPFTQVNDRHEHR